MLYPLFQDVSRHIFSFYKGTTDITETFLIYIFNLIIEFESVFIKISRPLCHFHSSLIELFGNLFRQSKQIEILDVHLL